MVRKSVAEILEKHVTFELECVDRMYLNAYVPSLQRASGFVWFLRSQLGCRVLSTAMIAPQSRAFAEAFESFAREQDVDLVTFAKGERKDDVLQRYLAAFTGDEGVLFVGKAQEKAWVFRTEKPTNAQGRKYPWIVRSTAMVNHWSDRRGSRITHFHALAHMPLPCGPEFVDQIADTSVLNGGRRPPDQLRGLTGPFRTTTFVVIASRTTRPPGSSATGSWTIAASASPYASSNLSRSMPSCRRMRASRPAPMSLAL